MEFANLKRKGGFKLGARRGQFTVVALVLTFVTLIVFVSLYPALASIISDASMTGAEGLLLDLMPFMFLVAILLVVLSYATPQRQYQQY